MFFMNLLFPVASIVLFFVDVVSDILLAREYYNEGMMWESGLTAFFVIVPSLIICIFGFIVYVGTFKEYPPVLRVTYFIMTLLMMSPVISQLEYIYYRIKYRNRCSSEQPRDEDNIKTLRGKYDDACFLSMLECFLEAAPQLTIQVYILLQHRNDDTLLTEGIRAVAIFSSWISMSWSLVAKNKSNKLTENMSMTIPGMVFYFLWRTTEIGTRIIAIGLFAAQFSYYVAIVVGVHLLLMLLWISFNERTDLRQDTCSKLFVILVGSCQMVFCFFNYYGQRARYKMLFYYIVVYIENCLLIGLWFHYTDHKGAWFHLPALLTVVVGIFVQLIFQLTYHRWFHPKGPIQISCKDFWCPPQDGSTANRPMKCSKCLEDGHRFAQCENDWKCRACNNTGHKEAECKSKEPLIENPESSDSFFSESDSESDNNNDGAHSSVLAETESQVEEHAESSDTASETPDLAIKKRRKSKAKRNKATVQTTLTSFMAKGDKIVATPDKEKRVPASSRSPPTPAEELNDKNKKPKS